MYNSAICFNDVILRFPSI